MDKISNTLTLREADGTRFVYGSDVDNNYVLYSDKIWRIVSINSDSSIKLVTQENITSMAWNSITSTDYSTSQVRNWLNNEFLPTLKNANDLLMESTWDYTAYTDSPATLKNQKITIEKISTTSSVANERVGLLNIYEYMMTVDSLKGEMAPGAEPVYTINTFLNNNTSWWTMSPRISETDVWYVSINLIGSSLPTVSSGVRPTVNLKSDVMITGGTGQPDSPYEISQ